METIRGLAVQGNEKLAAGIWHFDLPPIRSCPGRSKLCSSACYARRGHFCYPQVQERLDWAFAQSKRNDFVEKMIDEIYRKGVLVFSAGTWPVTSTAPRLCGKAVRGDEGVAPVLSSSSTRGSWRVRAIEPHIQLHDLPAERQNLVLGGRGSRSPRRRA